MGQIDQLLRRVAGAPVRTVLLWRSRGISWKVITSNLPPVPSLSIKHHQLLPSRAGNALFNIVIMTIIIFIHMIMMILASGSRILVARIIQFEVESNCETFLQMSIISISIRASPLSSLNVKYFVALVTRQYYHHNTMYDDDNDDAGA